MTPTRILAARLAHESDIVHYIAAEKRTWDNLTDVSELR